ncbi:MAG TPA: hypothetical protein VGR00_05740, partial [Thermoanaerobaculia bacterium]|nr:hypothetical protein [Thermoanaerobaculia bacterium]
ERLLHALPYAVFGVLFLLTYRRWILPFQDSGREVMTAARLADGERLYVDVASWYGPLPNSVDALLFRAFGKHLDVLIAFRTLLALAGVEALRRLLKRLVVSEAAAAVGASFVVATCFFMRLGGAYPFPYSIGALEGFVGLLWALELALGAAGFAGCLAAAVVAGLAAGTKLEFFPAAIAGLGAGLLLSGEERGRMKRAAVGVAVAGTLGAAAYLLPIAIVGRETIEKNGFLIARHLPETWQHLYALIFWAGGDGATFPGRFLVEVLLPTAVFVGLGVFAARKSSRTSPVALSLFFAGGVACVLAPPPNHGLGGLVPFAIVALLWEVGRTAKSGDLLNPGKERAALFTVGVAMAPLLLRQPFSLLPNPYSAFSGPLPLAVAFVFLARIAGTSPRFFVFFAGLTAAQMGVRSYEYHRAPMRRFDFDRGSLTLYDREGILLDEIVSTLKARTPAGSYVAVFPESGMVLFLSDRKNPFDNEQFLPGMQSDAQEDEMIRRLDERPPAAAVLVNRSLHEYGARLFGFGYLERFRAELERRMVVEKTLGQPDRTISELPFPARADEAYFLVPAPHSSTAPATERP